MVASQRKILVTGGIGQQGGSLARLLLQEKHKVYALTRNTQSAVAQDLRNKGANIVKGVMQEVNCILLLQHLLQQSLPTLIASTLTISVYAFSLRIYSSKVACINIHLVAR